MMRRELPLKRALGVIGAIAVIVVLVIVSNVWLWLSEGKPTIPQLENRWWAGYYETTQFGRQRCVARFTKGPSGRLQMALLSPWGAPDVFTVDRSTSSESFVYLTMADPQSGIRIEAKQPYVGKRYYFGRLMVGRFRDFWKMNDDVSIRGHFASTSPPRKFGVEPIEENELLPFWSKYVRPERPTPGPVELMRSAGVLRVSPQPAARWTEEERTGYGVFLSALDTYARGVKLLETLTQNGETLGTADVTAIVSDLREALSQAERVPVSTLERAHPEMRERWQRDFQGGLRAIIVGLEMKESRLLLDGGHQCDAYVLWHRSHAEQIEVNRNK
jgi:hypothetical protein